MPEVARSVPVLFNRVWIFQSTIPSNNQIQNLGLGEKIQSLRSLLMARGNSCAWTYSRGLYICHHHQSKSWVNLQNLFIHEQIQTLPAGKGCLANLLHWLSVEVHWPVCLILGNLENVCGCLVYSIRNWGEFFQQCLSQTHSTHYIFVERISKICLNSSI